MMDKSKKLLGKFFRRLLPIKLYKLVANGVLVIPAYYKDIIRDAETWFDLSQEETTDKKIMLARKYAHIIDKGLHRPDAEAGHSDQYYRLLKDALCQLKDAGYADEPTLLWAQEKLKIYEALQAEEMPPLKAEAPFVDVSFSQFQMLVQSRRSNRYFKADTVSDTTISKLKNLANWASSSCNKQPIEIYTTNDPDLAAECLKCCKGGTGFSEFIPTFWAFTANVRGYVFPEEIYLPVVDTCLGVQNVMLGATTLGLSGTLLSWAQKNAEEELKLQKLLKIPPHHRIIICGVIGYADIHFMTPARKN